LESTKEGIQQVERFAVAMLALALKLEPKFLREFLQRMCDRSSVEKEERFLIELEMAGCGDLIIRKEDDSEAYVLEFKVGSPIQTHNQDPKVPEFFTNGYGAGIKKKPWMKSTYILVQNKPAVLKIDAAETWLNCLGKSWHDVYRCSHDHPLIRDLFESFGSLGIPEFIHMNTKNMSLGHGAATLEVVKLHELLKAVAGYFGSKTSKFDVKLDSDNSYIGMNFSPNDSTEEWQKLIKPKGCIGWFGYQYENQKPTLDVWFYCGNKDAAKCIQAILAKHFPREVQPPDMDNNVRVSLLAENSQDNQEWFISVFESLVPSK
jgi:hypothetical protein